MEGDAELLCTAHELGPVLELRAFSITLRSHVEQFTDLSGTVSHLQPELLCKGLGSLMFGCFAMIVTID